MAGTRKSLQMLLKTMFIYSAIGATFLAIAVFLEIGPPRTLSGDYPTIAQNETGDGISRGSKTNFYPARCTIPASSRCSIENPNRTVASSFLEGDASFSEYVPGRDCVFQNVSLTKYTADGGREGLLKIWTTRTAHEIKWNTNMDDRTEMKFNQYFPQINVPQNLYAPSVLCTKEYWPAQEGTWRSIRTQYTEYLNLIGRSIGLQKSKNSEDNNNVKPPFLRYSSSFELNKKYDPPLKRYSESGCTSGETTFLEFFHRMIRLGGDSSSEGTKEPKGHGYVTGYRNWIFNGGNPYFNNAEYNSGLGLGIGEGCPCLPLAEDAASDLEIDCVLNSPSAIRNMWYSMTSDGNKVEGTANEYDGDVNVMENEMLTIVPYRTDRPLVPEFGYPMTDMYLSLFGEICILSGILHLIIHVIRNRRAADDGIKINWQNNRGLELQKV